jgi:threonine aldolase
MDAMHPFQRSYLSAVWGLESEGKSMINLASDNVVGASKQVLEALFAANSGAEAAYGSDPYSAEAEAMLADLFEHEVKVFLVATGTGANALALAALSPPWGAIFCHEEGHVADDECGAPEMFTDGAKLIGLPGVNGKITAERLETAIARYPKGVVKAVQPSAVSISQVTECGTVYTLEEIALIGDIARRHALGFHLDGARFANALITLGCSPAEMTWKAGVDIVSFGATKNGCLACEAVIFFDPARAENFEFRRKRSGHTLSKGRLLGAQMSAYLRNHHWLDNAKHANAMAQRLVKGLASLPGVRLPWPCQANEVFAVLPKSTAKILSDAGVRAAPWYALSASLPPDEKIGRDEVFWRFVTSFETKLDEIDQVIELAQG